MGNSQKRAQEFKARNKAMSQALAVSSSMNAGSSIAMRSTEYHEQAQKLTEQVVREVRNAQNMRHVYADECPSFAGMVMSYGKDHARVLDGSVQLGDPILFDEHGQETLDESIGFPLWTKNTKLHARIVKAYDESILSPVTRPMLDADGKYIFPVFDLVTSPIGYALGVINRDLAIAIHCADQFKPLRAHERKLLHAMVRACQDVTTVYTAVVAMNSAIMRVMSAKPTTTAENLAKMNTAMNEAIEAFITTWANIHLVTLDATDLRVAVESSISGNTGMTLVAASNAVSGAHAAYVAKMVESRKYTHVGKIPEQVTPEQVTPEQVTPEINGLPPQAIVLTMCQHDAMCYPCAIAAASHRDMALNSDATYLTPNNTPLCASHYAKQSKADKKACVKITR